MKIKARIVQALLRLYPAGWRAEYGEELGALLMSRRITLYVILDVSLSAARERLRRSEVWRMSGMVLFAGTACTIYVNNTTPRLSYFWFPPVWNVVLIATGCLTSLRDRSTSPSWATVKAALLGYIPEIVAFVLWIAGIFHPLVLRAGGPFHLLESRLALFDMTFPTPPRPQFGVIPLALASLFLDACVAGLIGGILGRAMAYFWPRLRRC